MTNMTSELLTMHEAAQRLGMTYDAILAWLYRHPEYRPTKKVGRNVIWTEDEIEAVRKARSGLVQADTESD